MRDAVVARMRALPGVERVAFAIRAPLSLSEAGIAVATLLPSHPELRDPVSIKFNAVSSDFLDATGTRVVRGRGLTAADNAGGPPVVLINQSMAEKYWPGQDPLGQVVRLASSKTDARVVGVTENAPIGQIGELPEPYMYVPFDQYLAHMSNMGEITFALETRQNAMSMAQAVRQVLIHTDPSEAGAKGLAAKRAAAEGAGDPGAAGLAAGDPPPARTAPRRLADEDPELAAYNDRLAALAAEGRPKTWRRP